MSLESVLIDESVELFGEEASKKIFRSMFDTIQFATELHGVHPIRDISVGFGEWPYGRENQDQLLRPVIGLSDGYYGLKMMLNVNAPVEELVGHASAVALHEVTHAAQHQYVWFNQGVHYWEHSYSFLRRIYDEGVALWWEYEYFPQLYSETDFDLRNMAGYVDYEEELREIAFYGTEYEHEDLIQYLFGDQDTPKKGYCVAKYLVDKLVETGRTVPTELVKISDARLNDITQALLERK